jgi:hypothetical protein
LYPLQYVTVLSVALALQAPEQVAPVALHVPVPLDVSHTAPPLQSAFVVQFVLHAPDLHVYSPQSALVAVEHLPEPSHFAA